MRKPLFSWVMLISVVSMQQALAYIPPTQFITKMMGDKHGGIKKVRVRSEVIAVEEDHPSTGYRFKETTVYDGVTNTLRSWATDAAGNDLYGVIRGVTNMPAGVAILFDSNSAQLVAALKGKGIPVKTQEDFAGIDDEATRSIKEATSLARLGSTVAWVIGPRGESPQLWVEKDTFLPLKLIYAFPSGYQGDVRYENYRFYREFPFPRLIQVSKKPNGPVVLRDELIEVTVTRDENSQEYKAPVKDVVGFTAAGNSAPDGVKDLISIYYGSVR
ncbi:MAG: hypothetical protein AABZ55_08625 [Bdellovibrionota bacterium]